MRKRQYYNRANIWKDQQENTIKKLREVSFCYEKLGKMMEEGDFCGWELERNEQENIWGSASLKVCAECGEYRYCSREKQDELKLEMRMILSQLEKGGPQGRIALPESLKKRCHRPEEFARSIAHAYEMVNIEKIWKNKLIVQRKVMARHLQREGQFLYNLAGLMRHESGGFEKQKQLVYARLHREKIRIECMEIFENRYKKREISICIRRKTGRITTARITSLISKVLKCSFMPAEDICDVVGKEAVWIHLIEAPCFRVLTGIASCTKSEESVSGDLHSVVKLKGEKQIYILSDGMGSGSGAYRESRRLIELLEQLLKAGFQEEEAFKMVNSILAFGLERDCCSALDLFSIQMYSGILKIMKFAGAPSFLIRNDRVETVFSRNVPAGILWDVEFDVLYKKLYDGDKVVLISDGILPDGQETLLDEFISFLERIKQKNPQYMADEILQWAYEHQNRRAEDDMAAIVISLWRKQK